MPQTNRTILLVEDNPDDVTLTQRALKKNNITSEIVVAKDGVEAIDYLFCNGPYAERDSLDLPDLILLDLKLPKLGGLEVLKMIKNNPKTAKQPVVVLTTSNENSDIENSYNLGANSYIQKPLFFESFITAVGQIGMYWLTLNQSPPDPVSS